MGKSTISVVMFNSYVSLPDGNHWSIHCRSGWAKAKQKTTGPPCRACALFIEIQFVHADTLDVFQPLSFQGEGRNHGKLGWTPLQGGAP
jgi:hypothetical protein